MKKTFIIILLFFGANYLTKAQKLDLSTCLDSAVAYMPALQQDEAIRNTLSNKLRSHETVNLPSLQVNGQITYQSAVPELPFTIPNMPGLEIPQTQFRTYLEVTQPIYNGGMANALKGAETANAMVQIEQLKISELNVKKQVTELYYNVVEIEYQKATLDKTLELVLEKQKVVESAIKNGVAQQNDLLKLQTQVLSLQNQKSMLAQRQNAAKEVLEILCGFEITDSHVFRASEADFKPSIDLKNNAEIKYLNAKTTALKSSEDLLKSKRMPKVMAFGQSGFGQPNPLNFFEADVSGYYMVGAKLQWKLTDWGNTQRDIENLEISTDQIALITEQKSIELNSKIAQMQSEIEILEKAINNDEQLLKLKAQIVTNAKKQYEEGIITFTDYMNEELELKQTEMALGTHKTQLLKTQYLLQLEIGNL
ncbi:MAG: TolC family protein [Bacteroidia bacterium]